MRITIDLDDDVTAEVARLHRERGLGVSAVVNELARRGLRTGRHNAAYVHPSYEMDALIDLSNVADVLEFIDGDSSGGTAYSS